MFSWTGALNTHIVLMSDSADLAFKGFKYHPHCNNKKTKINQTLYFYQVFGSLSAMLQCCWLPEKKWRQVQGKQLFSAVQGCRARGPGEPKVSLWSFHPHHTAHGRTLHSAPLPWVCSPESASLVLSENNKGHPRQPSVYSLNVPIKNTMEVMRYPWILPLLSIKQHCSVTTLGKRNFWIIFACRTYTQFFFLRLKIIKMKNSSSSSFPVYPLSVNKNSQELHSCILEATPFFPASCKCLYWCRKVASREKNTIHPLRQPDVHCFSKWSQITPNFYFYTLCSTPTALNTSLKQN